MINNQFFEKHHSRLVTEGVIRSVLHGLAIGFSVDFLMSLMAWIFDFGSLWLAVGCGIGAAIVSGVLFYFLKFRPDPEEIARRVDRLGLEERLITMMELQGEDSYIANLQRSDAKEHLKDVSDRKLCFKISKALAVLTLVSFLFSASMTTVLALSEKDIISSGSELINPEDPLENYVALSYVVEEGGEIVGEADQLILPGEDGTPVVAVAEEGWIFVGWDDGVETPERQDLKITEDMEIFAMFEEIGEGIEGSGGDGAEGPSEDSDGDQASDAPDENASSGEGEPGDAGSESSGEGSEGKPNDNNSNNGGESQDGGEGEGGQGSSGKWNDNNQFLDGNTYYRDYLEMYYNMAQDIFSADGTIPPELIEFFESYFNSI